MALSRCLGWGFRPPPVQYRQGHCPGVLGDKPPTLLEIASDQHVAEFHASGRLKMGVAGCLPQRSRGRRRLPGRKAHTATSSRPRSTSRCRSASSGAMTTSDGRQLACVSEIRIDRLTPPETSPVPVLVGDRLVAALEILADRLVEPPSQIVVIGRGREKVGQP